MPQNSTHPLPIIAIVGRPNVGKSSLFNRLTHKRISITSDIAGTTRDRIYHHIEVEDIPAILVDTGGLEYGKKENIEADVQSQARLAIDEADLVLFVVDASEGLTSNDYEAAQLLRKTQKPLLFIANKFDHTGFEENIQESLELGFGEPIRISTIHKIGLFEFEEILAETLSEHGWEKTKKIERESQLTHICFVGRPNAGKSSLVNALFGQEKLIVSPIAGTTRDAVDTEVEWQDQKFNMIDTAGLRRRGKARNLERITVLRSLEAIERADIVCLILDYEQGISKQDQHIVSYVTEAGKGLLIVVNKCDLMKKPQEERNHFTRILRYKFDFLPWAPVIFVSALKKKNLEKIFELSQEIQKERSRQIDNEELQALITETVYKHLPPRVSHTRPKIYSLRQTDTHPPTFVIEVNDPEMLHFSYRRYLENELRRTYNFTGTTIKVVFKKKYVKE